MKETDAKILTSAEPTHTNHDVSEILVSETISMFFLSRLSPRCYKPNTRTLWFTLTGLGTLCQDGQIHIQIPKKENEEWKSNTFMIHHFLLEYILSQIFMKYSLIFSIYFLCLNHPGENTNAHLHETEWVYAEVWKE